MPLVLVLVCCGGELVKGFCLESLAIERSEASINWAFFLEGVFARFRFE